MPENRQIYGGDLPAPRTPNCFDTAPGNTSRPTACHHHVAVLVVGATVAVLVRGPAEPEHDRHEDVGQDLAKVGGEDRECAGENA